MYRVFKILFLFPSHVYEAARPTNSSILIKYFQVMRAAWSFFLIMHGVN